MLVLSTGLTSGHITFIFRVIIQFLSYGGIFLIGLQFSTIYSQGNTRCPQSRRREVNGHSGARWQKSYERVRS